VCGRLAGLCFAHPNLAVLPYSGRVGSRILALLSGIGGYQNPAPALL